MINIKLYWEDKFLRGIESRGHSGYAERGDDIVCAAVSSLVQALLLGLDEIAKIKGLEYEIDDQVPLIKIFWPSEQAESVDLLTRSVALSLKAIADGDGRDYVNVIDIGGKKL